MMQAGARRHRLIDVLDEDQLTAVEDFLARRVSSNDPFLATLAAAAVDDEPLSADDERVDDKGLAAIERGELASQAEVQRALGPWV